MLVVLLIASVTALTCLDQHGNAVDYWVALKHSNDFNYTVYNNVTGAFDIETYFVSRGGYLSNTLQSLYKAASTSSYLFINDETPSMVSKDEAHQKTVIGIGATTGFWLIHSVPRFPVDIADYAKNGYSFPDMEKKYGQTFMCLTLPVAAFETLAQAFYIDNPQVYDSQLLPATASKLPTMVQVINNKHETSPTAKTFNVKTVGGKAFTIFAKNKAWAKELYEDFVAPTINDGLMVETWMNGVGKIGSTCKPFKVVDITSVKLPSGVTWKETQDHSKWAVGASTNWACVGDINRQQGQADRGGGTYCTKDAKLAGAFTAIIDDIDACQ